MRQTQVQHAAAALSLCEQQPSAVRLRNLTHERQAKTKRCAAAHERPVIVHRGGAPPAGKQVIELRRVQSRTGIGNRNRHKIPRIGQRNRDFTVLRCYAQRVCQQVIDCRTHQSRVNERVCVLRHLYDEFCTAHRRMRLSLLYGIAAER